MQVSQSDSQWLYFTLARGGDFPPWPPKATAFQWRKERHFSSLPVGLNIKTGAENMEKSKAWDYALGIIKVDGLEPSEDFLKLVEREKRGEISDQDIKDFLDKKYKSLGGKKDD